MGHVPMIARCQHGGPGRVTKRQNSCHTPHAAQSEPGPHHSQVEGPCQQRSSITSGSRNLHHSAYLYRATAVRLEPRMPIIPGYMGYSIVPNTLVHERGPTETGINLANCVYHLDIWYPLEARSYLPNESGNTSPRPWSSSCTRFEDDSPSMMMWSSARIR